MPKEGKINPDHMSRREFLKLLASGGLLGGLTILFGRPKTNKLTEERQVVSSLGVGSHRDQQETPTPNYQATASERNRQHLIGTVTAQSTQAVREKAMSEIDINICSRQADINFVFKNEDIIGCSGTILHSRGGILLMEAAGHSVAQLQAKINELSYFIFKRFNRPSNEPYLLLPDYVDFIAYKDSNFDRGIIAAKIKPDYKELQSSIFPEILTNDPKIDPSYSFEIGNELSAIVFPRISEDLSNGVPTAVKLTVKKTNGDGNVECEGDIIPGLSGSAVFVKNKIVGIETALSYTNPDNGKSFVVVTPCGIMLDNFSKYCERLGEDEIVKITRSLQA